MMDESKVVLRRYMICQQCGKRWEGIDPDCYITAYRHAKTTGHYVYGKTVFYTEWNRKAGDPPNELYPNGHPS
ncbi:MAG: hypothetical protein PHC31_00990 [Clostridia bacterium]|nr:hypothetical protein [Clostridia bacterium]